MGFSEWSFCYNSANYLTFLVMTISSRKVIDSLRSYSTGVGQKSVERRFRILENKIALEE